MDLPAHESSRTVGSKCQVWHSKWRQSRTNDSKSIDLPFKPAPFGVADVAAPTLLPVVEVKLVAPAAADVDGVGDVSVLPPSFLSTIPFKLLLLWSNVVLEALMDVPLIVTALVEELLLAEDEDALFASLSISSVTWGFS